MDFCFDGNEETVRESEEVDVDTSLIGVVTDPERIISSQMAQKPLTFA